MHPAHALIEHHLLTTSHHLLTSSHPGHYHRRSDGHSSVCVEPAALLTRYMAMCATYPLCPHAESCVLHMWLLPTVVPPGYGFKPEPSRYVMTAPTGVAGCLSTPQLPCALPAQPTEPSSPPTTHTLFSTMSTAAWRTPLNRRRAAVNRRRCLQ